MEYNIVKQAIIVNECKNPETITFTICLENDIPTLFMQPKHKARCEVEYKHLNSLTKPKLCKILMKLNEYGMVCIDLCFQ